MEEKESGRREGRTKERKKERESTNGFDEE